MDSNWIQGMENSGIQLKIFTFSDIKAFSFFFCLFFPFVFHLFVKLADRKQLLKSCYSFLIAKVAAPLSCDMVVD